MVVVIAVVAVLVVALAPSDMQLLLANYHEGWQGTPNLLISQLVIPPGGAGTQLPGWCVVRGPDLQELGSFCSGAAAAPEHKTTNTQ